MAEITFKVSITTGTVIKTKDGKYLHFNNELYATEAGTEKLIPGVQYFVKKIDVAKLMEDIVFGLAHIIKF